MCVRVAPVVASLRIIFPVGNGALVDLGDVADGDDQRGVGMAQIAPDVIASVDRFLAAVCQRLRITAAYLYGSQVTGAARSWSDIDVAVISPDFSDDLFQDRVALMKLAATIDDRIEPQPFTPDRFGPNDPLASEISQNGVRLM